MTDDARIPFKRFSPRGVRTPQEILHDEAISWAVDRIKEMPTEDELSKQFINHFAEAMLSNIRENKKSDFGFYPVKGEISDPESWDADFRDAVNTALALAIVRDIAIGRAWKDYLFDILTRKTPLNKSQLGRKENYFRREALANLIFEISERFDLKPTRADESKGRSGVDRTRGGQRRYSACDIAEKAMQHLKLSPNTYKALKKIYDAARADDKAGPPAWLRDETFSDG